METTQQHPSNFFQKLRVLFVFFFFLSINFKNCIFIPFFKTKKLFHSRFLKQIVNLSFCFIGCEKSVWWKILFFTEDFLGFTILILGIRLVSSWYLWITKAWSFKTLQTGFQIGHSCMIITSWHNLILRLLQTILPLQSPQMYVIFLCCIKTCGQAVTWENPKILRGFLAGFLCRAEVDWTE